MARDLVSADAALDGDLGATSVLAVSSAGKLWARTMLQCADIDGDGVVALLKDLGGGLLNAGVGLGIVAICNGLWGSDRICGCEGESECKNWENGDLHCESLLGAKSLEFRLLSVLLMFF